MAFSSLLHGDADEYFIYALVLAGQLRRYSPNADRVLLLGAGRFHDSSVSHEALQLAGWTHLLAVDMIDTPHLDKTYLKRHRHVFTKLRALELGYNHLVLLDLDLLPRDGVDLTGLFNVQAPAGKYHGAQNEALGVQLVHGKRVPAAAQVGYWCPNAGVLRIDPKTTPQERHDDLAQMLKHLNQKDAHVSTYLPEQYYLAQTLHGWHHIGTSYNYELGFDIPETGCERWEISCDSYATSRSHSSKRLPKGVLPMNSEMELKTLDDVKVWHFSGKCGMLQPWMFQDKGGALEVETWLIKFYGIIDPGNIVAIAFAEWHKSLQLLLLQERGFERLSDVTDALERLYQRSESERQSCDHFLT